MMQSKSISNNPPDVQCRQVDSEGADSRTVAGPVVVHQLPHGRSSNTYICKTMTNKHNTVHRARQRTHPVRRSIGYFVWTYTFCRVAPRSVASTETGASFK